MATPSEKNFWQFDTNYWFTKLGSSAEGLESSKAAQLLSDKTSNEESTSAFKKGIGAFLRQYKSPLMLLLIGAVLISGFLGDRSDVLIILSILLSSGILSFIQERNAGKVVQKLQALISKKTKVRRNGTLLEIPSGEVVEGDVIIVGAGDIIPADCLLIDTNELYANEASLTGESYPVFKKAGTVAEQTILPKRTNVIWEGTSIQSGNGSALVIHTGKDSIFGGIARTSAEEIETSFEMGIRHFGYFLMKITLILAAFVLFINLLDKKSLVDSALFALALAVGMAPELLPAIATIAMSAGAKRMLAKKVIVKKLNSIQNLGEINLLCTDKTGTITEGAISVYAFYDALGKESAFVRKLACVNAALQDGYNNPIDEALKKAGVEAVPEKIGIIPYDFNRKRLSVAFKDNGAHLLVCKGAFSNVIEVCSRVDFGGNNIQLIDTCKQDLQLLFNEYGAKGFRVLGLCYKKLQDEVISKELEKDMLFGGFILFKDPVKEGIPETIKALKDLEIGLKIITGDNKRIAESIARGIGIAEPRILTGTELTGANEKDLPALVKNIHVFAEVEPVQKEWIIKALRKNFTVAYMGDGINDVSAIHAADVGISVDNAVDVARDAADFVLMEKDLMVIVEGVKEGRKTFANTLKYLYISTGSTFGNMCSVAAASLILPFLPLLPKQILLINFLTDLPFLTVASDNVDEDQLRNPGKWNLSLIKKYMLVFGIHSSFFDLLTFALLYFYMRVSEAVFQTGWFIESVLTELFILFIIRTHRSFFRSKPGRYMLIFSSVALVLTIALPYFPFARDMGIVILPGSVFLMVACIVLGYILTADLLKVWFFRKYAE
jgi:Mg2+-importing ATPase